MDRKKDKHELFSHSPQHDAESESQALVPAPHLRFAAAICGKKPQNPYALIIHPSTQSPKEIFAPNNEEHINFYRTRSGCHNGIGEADFS